MTLSTEAPRPDLDDAGRWAHRYVAGPVHAPKHVRRMDNLLVEYDKEGGNARSRALATAPARTEGDR